MTAQDTLERTATAFRVLDAIAFPPVRTGERFLEVVKSPAGSAPLPMVGDDLLLCFTDMAATRLEARCTLRARIYLLASGLVRVTGPFNTEAPMRSPDGDGALNLLRSAEQGSPDCVRHQAKLALAAGFADYSALWAAQKKLRLDRQHRAPREVIGWKLV